MRARVAAQFTTVVLLLGASGVITLNSLNSDKPKPKAVAAPISSSSSSSSTSETH
jgi:hypothetical protein